MTFKEIRDKIIAYWWIIIATFVGVVLVFLPWSSQRMFVSENIANLHFSNPAFSDVSNSAQGYVDSMEAFTLYLVNRFESIGIQQKIVQESKLAISSLKDGSPFYDVTLLGGGYVSISYTASSSQEADMFNQGVKSAFEQIISDWNQSRLPEYQVNKTLQPTSTVVDTSKPLQLQVLPVLVAVLVAIIVVLILPVSEKKSKSSKTK